jgi:hypothetical protein
LDVYQPPLIAPQLRMEELPERLPIVGTVIDDVNEVLRPFLRDAVLRMLELIMRQG